MRLVKGAKRAQPTIPVVSMSDIAFLLIIFFLVTTNFVKEGGIRLKLPKSSEAQRQDKIQISVSVDQDAKVYLNGEPIELNSLQSRIASLLSHVQGEFRKVYLKCDKGITSMDFMPVIEKINGAGGLLVLKADEKSKTESRKTGKKEDDESATPEPKRRLESTTTPAPEARPESEDPFLR